MAADSIIVSVRQWSGKQDDDLTVLICDYTPQEWGGGFDGLRAAGPEIRVG
jgi:hypothetical protein